MTYHRWRAKYAGFNQDQLERMMALQRENERLRRELAGLYSARRGTFRVLYRIDDAEHLVTVVRVEHRADAYRRR